MSLETKADYARRNKVSRKTVTTWDDNKLLVMRTRKGVKLVDVEASDKLRSLLQDPAKKKGARGSDDAAPGIDANQDYKTARAWVERYKAANQKLQFEIKSGEYVKKASIVADNFKAARIFRDALLNIGPRIAPILATEKDEYKILEILKTESTAILKEMVKALEGVGK